MDSEEGPVPGEALQCQSHGGTVSAARALADKEGNGGALAFSHLAEPQLGKFQDATVLKSFGRASKAFLKLADRMLWNFCRPNDRDRANLTAGSHAHRTATRAPIDAFDDLLMSI